jgi:hypothetical protein
MGMPVINPSIQEAERQDNQEFKASPGHTDRPCLKQTNGRKMKKGRRKQWRRKGFFCNMSLIDSHILLSYQCLLWHLVARWPSPQ